MADSVTILPTTIEHIRAIIKDLREDDLRECQKWGVSPFKGIWRSYKGSKWCRSGFINGRIVGIWGLNGSVLGFCGNPWLMTSNEADKYPFIFTSVYRREIKKMLKSYQLLESYCDTSYAKSLKMMRLIGFKEREFVPTKNGGLLVRLEMVA